MPEKLKNACAVELLEAVGVASQCLRGCDLCLEANVPDTKVGTDSDGLVYFTAGYCAAIEQGFMSYQLEQDDTKEYLDAIRDDSKAV